MPQSLASLKSLADAVPVRLTVEERQLQRLLCSALDVSEYTDKVDVYSRDRDRLIRDNLYDLYKIMLGLNINSSKDQGRKMLVKAFESEEDESVTQSMAIARCEDWFRKLFELGRRYKRMNPDKMRTEYGKLVTLMQDAVQKERLMSMSVYEPVRTVTDVLKEANLGLLLEDEQLTVAASPIEKTVAEEVSAATKEKEATISELCKKYGGDDAEKKEVVELCIRSLDDGSCFLRDNAASLARMIELLKHYYHPQTGAALRTKSGDISISHGHGGSKLAHSHAGHFQYVLESLTLWKCVLSDVFRLWSAAEDDMLDSSSNYSMRNTGQGIHRMKSAPRTGRAMRGHIATAQSQMGGKWVGTQIVHLGDNDVPNALVFIDKYTQIPRMINPIVKVIESLDSVAELPGQRAYLEKKFGSVEDCKLAILQDFFRHAFDGSGDDGGSCIDGRLTSAWNWCSKLHKKPFHHVFLLCGFQGFDGQW
ncbi:UPF0652 protein [Diplonema papillatum]|nr:UPF0652 protein [Diplonema papillatum]